MLFKCHERGSGSGLPFSESGQSSPRCFECGREGSSKRRGFELYRAIADFHTSVETQRNDLAHGSFGVMDDMPEAVLWMESRHVADFVLDFWNKIEHSTPTGPPIPTSQKERDQIRQQNLDRMFVYRPKDVETLLIDIERLWRTLGSFIYFLRNSRPTEIYQQLVDEPHVKAALANIRARGHLHEIECLRSGLL